MRTPLYDEHVSLGARKAFGNIDFLIINYGDPKVDRFIDISTEDWEYSINMISVTQEKMFHLLYFQPVYRYSI